MILERAKTKKTDTSKWDVKLDALKAYRTISPISCLLLLHSWIEQVGKFHPKRALFYKRDLVGKVVSE